MDSMCYAYLKFSMTGQNDGGKAEVFLDDQKQDDKKILISLQEMISKHEQECYKRSQIPFESKESKKCMYTFSFDNYIVSVRSKNIIDKRIESEYVELRIDKESYGHEKALRIIEKRDELQKEIQ